MRVFHVASHVPGYPELRPGDKIVVRPEGAYLVRFQPDLDVSHPAFIPALVSDAGSSRPQPHQRRREHLSF